MRTTPLGIILALVASLLLSGGARAAAPPGALDGRSWELASPSEKGGGEVGGPGSSAAGALQAAAQGSALAYGSSASFAGSEGSAPINQYLASRGTSDWITAGLTPSLLSGTYANDPYQLFSADLGTALLSSGWACRLAEAECAAANPPLEAGAPSGYRNLYLRDSAGYRALVTNANSPALAIAPEHFSLTLVGATPSLGQIVISTCAALTIDATEVPDGVGGCDPSEQNLYRWHDGSLALLNLLPGDPLGTPGAELAASGGAISADGSRVYFSLAGDLYLRQGAQTITVDEAQGGGGTFEAASADGALAYFTLAGHLYRFDAASEDATDLTPAGGVVGVLGASADGSYVYYLTGAGLFAAHLGTTTKVAAAADPVNYPPATGTARISADGTRLAFVSSASLTGYPNAGKAEVYVYDAPSAKLSCASCNPKGTAPLGPSTIPASRSFAEGEAIYKPRALSADGRRLFFDSADSLIIGDSNAAPDVYEWEADGSGTCTSSPGCLALISSGRVGGSQFADASASGDDVFFTTSTPLLQADREPEDRDLYDARVGGGFPEAPTPIPCDGDACQGPPTIPDEPAPPTIGFVGPGNPQPAKPKKPAKKKHKRKHRRHAHEKGGGQR